MAILGIKDKMEQPIYECQECGKETDDLKISKMKGHEEDGSFWLCENCRN